MANTRFSGSNLKVDRARQHLLELEGIVEAYLASDAISMKATPGDPTKPSGFAPTGAPIFAAFHFETKVDPMSPMAGAIIGDILHNLRSALDLMASEMAREHRESDDNVYFPFCSEESKLAEMIKSKHFDKCGPEAVELVTQMKPYKDGNTALRALHDLNIRDKHQTLIIQLVSVGGPIIDTRPDDGGPMRIVGDPNKPSSVSLTFPNDCALAGKDLLPTLHELVETVGGILEAFGSLPVPAETIPAVAD